MPIDHIQSALGEFSKEATTTFGADALRDVLKTTLTAALPFTAAAIGPAAGFGVLGFAFLSYLGIKRLHKPCEAEDVHKLVQELLKQNDFDNRRLRDLLSSMFEETQLDFADLRTRTKKLNEFVTSIKADTTRTNQLLLDQQGLFISLENFLLENFKEHAQLVRQANSNLADQIEALLKTEPALGLRDYSTDPAITGQIRLFYGYRQVTLVGRDSDLQKLAAFATNSAPFRWWLLTGPGGMGKSRLVFEFCLNKSTDFHAGFFFPEDDFHAWNTWQPRRPTFIAVDYVAGRPTQVATMLRCLAARKDLHHPVRVLLIERSTEGQWYKDLIDSGGNAELLKHTRYHEPNPSAVSSPPAALSAKTISSELSSNTPGIAFPGEIFDLQPLNDDDIWVIFEQIHAKKGLALPDRSRSIEAFRKIDPKCRPLFAAMAAAAMADHRDIRHWDSTSLLRAVLVKEQSRWRHQCPDEEKLKQHLNLLAFTTMAQGILKKNLYWRTSPIADEFPQRIDSTIYHMLTETNHKDILRPLEPDILGEYFVLTHFSEDNSDLLPAFLNLVWTNDSLYIATFLLRVISDFVDNTEIDRFLTPPTIADPQALKIWSMFVVDAIPRLVLGGRSTIADQLIEQLRQLAKQTGPLSEPHKSLCAAFFNRALAKGKSNDIPGELADYTAVIDMPDAPPDQKAKALNNRGVAKGKLNDIPGELADYTAVIEMPDAPPDQKAKALNNRGVTKRELNDIPGAIADYTAVIEMPDAPPDQKAIALYNRGVAKGKINDIPGAIADYTALIDMPDAPPDQKAMALYNRGVAKGQLNDIPGELADYTAVIDMPDAPPDQKAMALYNRGVTKGQLNNIPGAIADYTAVIDMPDAPPDEKAKALYNRGVAKGKLNDIPGELADYTAVIDMPDAPPDQKAMALNNRGVTKRQLNDIPGAIADYTALIDMPDAPPDQKAMALNNRGVAKGKLNDIPGELADYTAVIDMPDAPPDQKAKALNNRGVTKRELNDIPGAIADYTAVIDMPDALPDQKAKALNNRGVAKGKLNDIPGELADYTAVIDMPDAPPDQKAKALYNRGVAKGKLNDIPGELADYTAVIDMPDAPPDQKAKALNNRGVAKGKLNDIPGELADYTAVIEMPDAPPDQKAKALYNRGTMKGTINEMSGAISDLSEYLKIPNDNLNRIVSATLARAAAFFSINRSAEALADINNVLAIPNLDPVLRQNALELRNLISPESD